MFEPTDAFIDFPVWCREEGQEGPITKAELKQAFARGQVGLSTPFWAAGMPEPKPLASIRELRWLVSHRLGSSSTWSYCVLLLHAACMLCNDRVLTRDRLMADWSWCVVVRQHFSRKPLSHASRGELHINISDSNPCCCFRHSILA